MVKVDPDRPLFIGEGKIQYLNCRSIALDLYKKGYAYTEIHKILKEKGLISFSYHTLRQYMLLDPDFISRPRVVKQKRITREEIEKFNKSKELLNENKE